MAPGELYLKSDKIDTFGRFWSVVGGTGADEMILCIINWRVVALARERYRGIYHMV